MTLFRKLFALGLTASMLAACSSETASQSFQVTPSTDSGLQSQVAVALPRLLRACPGLNRYSKDFTPATVSSTSMRGYEGGIELAFTVSASPQALPSPLNSRSAQNSCYVSISSDASKAYIGKNACHSICTGIWQEHSRGLMGREYSLR